MSQQNRDAQSQSQAGPTYDNPNADQHGGKDPKTGKPADGTQPTNPNDPNAQQNPAQGGTQQR